MHCLSWMHAREAYSLRDGEVSLVLTSLDSVLRRKCLPESRVRVCFVRVAHNKLSTHPVCVATAALCCGGAVEWPAEGAWTIGAGKRPSPVEQGAGLLQKTSSG